MKGIASFIRLQSGYVELRKNGNFSDGRRFTFSTGVKLNKEHWDNKKQRQKRRTKNANQNNARLNLLEAKFADILNLYTAQGVKPSRKQLKQDLKKAIGEQKVVPKEKTITFLEFAKQLVEERQSGERRKDNGERFSKGTVKGNKSRLNVIEQFLITSKLTQITFEEIDKVFEKKLMKYLKNKGTIKSINAFSNYTRFVKLVMNASYDEHHKSTAYKKIKKFNVPVENVYLTEKDLQVLYKLDLSKSERLAEIRDVFLIGCETGLRFGDFSVIKKENIVFQTGGSPNLISIKNEKNKKIPVIPIKKMAQDILDKYNYNLPRKKSNQKFNDYLKELCELAGFTEEVTLMTGSGEETKRVCDAIGSHTARRSFARISYINKIPIIWIMKVLGHSKESQTLKYIGMGNIELGSMIADNDYFKKGYEERKSEHTHLKAI